MQEGLRDFREKMYWGPGRARGGEGLLCLTSTPACFRRSVVVEPPDNIHKGFGVEGLGFPVALKGIGFA